MAGSAHSEAYLALCRALVAARHDAGLSQAKLAHRLGKPPSFVGKYELGERRLDVVELFVILSALGLEFETFWERASLTIPHEL